jgi:hypothetical protein
MRPVAAAESLSSVLQDRQHEHMSSQVGIKERQEIQDKFIFDSNDAESLHLDVAVLIVLNELHSVSNV